MSIIRVTLPVFTIAAFSAHSMPAQDMPAAQAPGGAALFETVKKEYRDAAKSYYSEYRAAYDEAKKNGMEKEFKFDKPSPAAQFSPRFLAIAEQSPEGPDAIDALKLSLLTSYGRKAGTVLETRAKAIKVLADYYVAKPSIKGLLDTLTMFDDGDSKALVAEVIARNPDRKVQAAAYKGQIAYRETLVRFAETVKDPKQLEMIEKNAGKGFVKEQLAKAEKAKAEIDGLKETLREKFGDIIADLSIGKSAPEIKAQTIDGSAARLAALKGKIVVLDVWATWCGPCKAMIPHEREMVERLKDKPFQLVSLSIDDEVKTLKEFLTKEKMPWTHWSAGPGGWSADFAQDWDIRSIPAIFVLDAEGVIRYKNIRGEELEKAVNALLSEATAGPKKGA